MKSLNWHCFLTDVNMRIHNVCSCHTSYGTNHLGFTCVNFIAGGHYIIAIHFVSTNENETQSIAQRFCNIKEKIIFLLLYRA